jgi:sigma-E factor negative regulatory protein RseB
MTESRVRTLPGAEHPVEHMVYSDGLASVSVFVEPAEATDKELSGLSRMGAAHAFTLILDGQQITAVGEVPPITVERIARSLRAAEAPAH